MSNEDTLISKLIDETYLESIEKDEPNSCLDLRKYFEKRLNQVDFHSVQDYLEQNHLSHSELRYSKKTGCYRLSFKESILDFPSNWSVFKEIETTDCLYISQADDQDYLLDIFAEICGSFQEIILVKASNEVQLIFISAEESITHVDWLKNYFEKKNNSLENSKSSQAA